MRWYKWRFWRIAKGHGPYEKGQGVLVTDSKGAWKLLWKDYFFRTSEGSMEWYWLIVIYAILSTIFNPMDDTDKSYFKRSGLVLYTDNKTGLQYIKPGLFGSMTPRLDENGNHMRKEKW